MSLQSATSEPVVCFQGLAGCGEVDNFTTSLFYSADQHQLAYLVIMTGLPRQQQSPNCQLFTSLCLHQDATVLVGKANHTSNPNSRSREMDSDTVQETENYR